MKWLEQISLPRMVLVRKSASERRALAVSQAVREELGRTRLLEGMRLGTRVAVGVGSRGIDGQAEIVRAVIQAMRDARLEPFVIPAMGSHGGATSEGQLRLLADYGITPETMSVVFEAGMDAQLVGQTARGFPVYTSRVAREAEGIFLVNRVKPHTDFGGAIGSGLLKMAVVGLGKHLGALAFHRAAQRVGHEAALREMASVVLRENRLIGGLAILEDERHRTARVEVVPSGDLESAEGRLAAEAGGLMPRLPLEDIDLLIVDRIGKNISGTGMDPNVIGRMIHGYSLIEQELPTRPRIRRIVVRDLTPESHGNATGIGMADFTTTRLVRAMDSVATYTNALTALSLQGSKIPIHFAADRQVLCAAISSLGVEEVEKARVIRILDTLSLERVEVSEGCLEELSRQSGWSVVGRPAPMRFDGAGDLLELGV